MADDKISLKENIKLPFKKGFEWLKKQYDKNRILTILGLFLAFTSFIFIVTIYSKALGSGINYTQRSVDTIILASKFIMVSVGLTLTTRVRKFGNFAHAEFVLIGIYVSVALDEINPNHDSILQILFIELIVAFIFTGLMAIACEVLVFGPLTRRNATPLSLMVSSIGIGMVIRQVVQEIYGSVPRTSAPDYPDFFDKLGQYPILELFFAESTQYNLPYIEIRISRDEVWAIVSMIMIVLSLRYIFTRTTLGMSMRATADDPSLAQITGINTKRVIYWTWFIAGGVSGVGAIFVFEAAQVQPSSGFVLLLIIFAVVILGGFDSFEGTLISGFIIATSMTMTVLVNSQLADLSKKSKFIDFLVFWSTNGDWVLVVPFAIIIIVLFIRPRGIFGVVDPRSKL